MNLNTLMQIKSTSIKSIVQYVQIMVNIIAHNILSEIHFGLNNLHLFAVSDKAIINVFPLWLILAIAKSIVRKR